ncbi:MAG: class I SAM-dependent methyltransferase [Patescibacteria group bacterium]|nr:class I SAM-dependent methyltransferase [Patescibacteria group bacterium]
MFHSKVPGGNELLNPEKILKDELGLTSGAYVGDFGCGGAGYFAIQAGKIVGDSGLVYAVDILQPVLKNIESRAKELNLNNIKLVWSNLEKFGACKINNESLDFGLIINVLFQNKDKKTILKEVARMIKPLGKLLVVDWKEGRFPLGPRPDDKLSAEAIVTLTNEFGLKLAKKFEAGQYHYGLVFEKF